MNIGLWAVQVILAIFFILVGGVKLITPIDDLVAQMPWAGDVPALLVRFIGLAEIAGGLGLLLPSITRILPWLTPLAGAGLATTMVFAIIFHLTRGEFPNIVSNLILLALVAFVIYGRWKMVPIEAKS